MATTKPADFAQEPIDFVITWVDGTDPVWAAERDKWLAREKSHRWSDWATGAQRFRDWGLLRYWFRGVERFAPWVNRVHFVTWGHLPSWLDTGHPKLRIVRHEAFIPAEYLPTFNNNSIELNLHRIPDLSEQFTYFNDDFFLLRPVTPEHHFKNGLPRDFAGLTIGYLVHNRTEYTPRNAMLVNAHFNKNAIIRTHPFQWFNLRYGPRCLAMTTLLMPFPWFSGLQNNHLAENFLKSTFEEVWDKEGSELDRACRARFRMPDGYSQWLMQDWQRAKGAFVPISPQLGGYINAKKMRDSRAYAATVRRIIVKQKYRQISINDELASQEDFEFWRDAVRSAFEKLLPERSAYERN